MERVTIHAASGATSPGVPATTLGRLRIPIQPLAEAPLRSGSVQATAPGDPSVYARLRCVVVGGVADAELAVRLLIHFFDPTCSSTPVEWGAATLRTNRSGDGTVELALRVEDVPPAIRGACHGIRWELKRADEAIYRTANAAVTL